jgi:class 3 adenylate cyclase
MADYSQGELAELAGVPADQLRRMCDLAILTPTEDGTFDDSDVPRVRMLAACDDAGISLESIAGAIKSGHLSFAFIDQLFAQPQEYLPQSFGELAAGFGFSAEFVEMVFDSLGLPRPPPNARARQDDVGLMSTGAFARGMGFSDESVARNLRVYGEALEHLARFESQSYHENVECPMFRSGLDERQVRELASQVSAGLIPMIEALVLNIYRRHRDHAIIDHTVGHIEEALELAGLAPPRQEQPPAIAFLDLAGYTRLTEERGDEAAAELATALATLVQRTSRAYGGRPVKWLGDGVMFHFPRAPSAVRSGLDMVGQAPAASLPPAHVGISAGPIVERDGDFFGRTVNLASRIAGQAGPRQVLVSEDVVSAAAGHPSLRFERMGTFELKGFAKPVPLHLAERDH